MKKKDIISKLSKEQIEVTQNCGTEQPFVNEYWNNKEDGIYVDLISGKALFCSKHKYDSGSGWPSFYRVISNEYITLHSDNKLGYNRTEVKSTTSKSHLGHVFNDGPQITGLRYCINSASLKFIKKSEMKQLGYEKYLKLFKN